MEEEAYTWKITLSNGEVFEEAKGHKFELAWEEPDAVTKIELVGEKHFECNLKTGEFYVDNEIFMPDAKVKDPKRLYFRKRRQIRSDGINTLPPRTRYMYGYEANGKLHVATVQPRQGMKEEEITAPQNSKKISAKIPKEVDYKKELIDIPGLGPKIAKDIISVFPTLESLKIAVAEGRIIPVRDDIEKKIREKFK